MASLIRSAFRAWPLLALLAWSPLVGCDGDDSGDDDDDDAPGDEQKADKSTEGDDPAAWETIPTNGRYTGDKVVALMLTDGTIMVAFNDELRRLLPTGEVDTSFGTDGVVKIDPDDTNMVYTAMTVRFDGRIVLAGTASDYDSTGAFVRSYYKVLQLTADGVPVADFGDGGIFERSTNCRKTTPAIPCGVGGVAARPDGKIVVALYHPDSGVQSVTTVDEIAADGSEVNRDFYGYDNDCPGTANPCTAFRVALDADGTILTMGAHDSRYLYVTRQKADGVLDETFAGDGHIQEGELGLETDVSEIIAFERLAGGAFFVLAALDASVGTAGYRIMKITADGATDSAFGAAGSVDIPSKLVPRSLGVDYAGNIIVAGYMAAEGDSSASFAIDRLTPAGAVDETFGEGGAYRAESDLATPTVQAVVPFADAGFLALATGGVAGSASLIFRIFD